MRCTLRPGMMIVTHGVQTCSRDSTKVSRFNVEGTLLDIVSADKHTTWGYCVGRQNTAKRVTEAVKGPGEWHRQPSSQDEEFVKA